MRAILFQIQGCDPLPHAVSQWQNDTHIPTMVDCAAKYKGTYRDEEQCVCVCGGGNTQ